MSDWKKRRENICTYRRHIGHYQAFTRHRSLSWFFFQGGEIPAISGYTPKRHRTRIDLMILRKAQNFELSTQQTLGILDSEFNDNNKFIGK